MITGANITFNDAVAGNPVFNQIGSPVAYNGLEQDYITGASNSPLNYGGQIGLYFNTVNIEHLLPQKPHKDWKLDKREITGYVNLLGNLTLISKRINSSVQNGVVKDKLPELEKSELAVTKALIKELKVLGLEWGESQIRNRQNQLASLAYKTIWF